jgi:metal-responsive CopG/Arc/MetJ family transcriptional regulator
MKKKLIPEKIETKILKIMLPKELLKRLETLCAEKEMTIRDFVTDAIIEKLVLANKERRKKSRL